MTISPDVPVRTLMHRDVVTVDEGANLREICELMMEEEVGSVVVLNEGQVVGILTERDVVVALGNGVNADVITAEELMSDNPVSVDPDDSIRFAAERMLQAGVHHLPVLGAGEPLGIVSARDLFGPLVELAWSPEATTAGG